MTAIDKLRRTAGKTPVGKAELLGQGPSGGARHFRGSLRASYPNTSTPEGLDMAAQ